MFIFNETVKSVLLRNYAAIKYFIITKHPFDWDSNETSSRPLENVQVVTECISKITTSTEKPDNVSNISSIFEKMYTIQPITIRSPPPPTPKPLSRGQSAGGKPHPKKPASSPTKVDKQTTNKAQVRPQSAPAASQKHKKK